MPSCSLRLRSDPVWPFGSAELAIDAAHRSRHFELATVFVKYAVMRLIVVCKLVVTSCMIADIFTKATDEETFHRMNEVMRNSGKPAAESRVGLARARKLYESLLCAAQRER